MPRPSLRSPTPIAPMPPPIMRPQTRIARRPRPNPQPPTRMAPMSSRTRAPDAHSADAPAEHAAPAHGADPHAAPDAHAARRPGTRSPSSPNDPNQPYALIRTLEAVQDKIAAGSSRRAYLSARTHRARSPRSCRMVTDEQWRQPRNSRAAIIYALSGGDPGVLAKLLSLSPVPCVDDNLIKGLLDYSQGRNPEALELLSKIDARTLDPRAGGHLALAQAMLVADRRSQARHGLSRYGASARTRHAGGGGRAPPRGSRRRGSLDDLDAFQLLTSQYLRRFNKSVLYERLHPPVRDHRRRPENMPKVRRLFQQLAETLDMLGTEQIKLAIRRHRRGEHPARPGQADTACGQETGRSGQGRPEARRSGAAV